ncbi:MAG: C40 family peptidase [Negativicutes bacterium]|nr:C40 family peptidase [Negativicutes bacterium]
MYNRKKSIIVTLILCLSVMMITPAVPVAASPLSDLLSQTTSEIGSGNGLLNILLGLVLGKLLGNPAASGLLDIAKAPGAKTAAPSAPATLGASTASGEAIVADAQKYMGVPYVWGGVTPDGWDCSGFTQYVMKEVGITLPRTAAEQFAVGTPVDKDKLQTGDLVFFTTYKPGASHVGFYMGNGKFIHASSVAKEVTISPLDGAYYVAHYIGARRYSR